MNQKRILTIQDISCVGRCSLTVALPVISAAGIEASVIPTAVLSTHTGGFTGYTFRDLTADIAPITDHWQTLGLGFDAIYTGYLGSFEQLTLISGLFDRFKTGDNFIMVDPAMADNGLLYGGISPDFPKGMAELCSKADVIVPNLTEAVFMLGEPYPGDDYDRAYIEGLLKRLKGLGAPKTVLTGVCDGPNRMGVAVCDGEEIFYYFSDRIEGQFHGTGDVFASALLASFIKTGSLSRAAVIAADFTAAGIRRTVAAGTDRRYGVQFEPCLHEFIHMLDSE